jgi:phosphoribosylanthranilate isomerase
MNRDDTKTKSLETFQNETLRPILKIQHNLTLTLLQNHKHFKKEQYSQLTKDQFQKTIVKFIQTNLDLKNQLLGAIIGLFTLNEMHAYLLNKKEFNRRIIQMQLKRFVDTRYPDL